MKIEEIFSCGKSVGNYGDPPLLNDSECLAQVTEGAVVDNTGGMSRLEAGGSALGLTLPTLVRTHLERLGGELLKWNRKVNLTAIIDEDEVLEKHFLDSLAVLPELVGVSSVLDLGSGAGFPGLPLKIVRRELEVTMVDSVAKKVGFIKHAIAMLGLTGARGVHQRAKGNPDAEKLPRVDAVISRALVDLKGWLALAPGYAPAGKVVAMLGRAPAQEELERLAQEAGMRIVSMREYTLPFSGDPRAVAVFEHDRR